MRKSKATALRVVLICAMAASAAAQPKASDDVQVADSGRTTIVTHAPDGQIVVTVSTRFALPAEKPLDGITGCSGGRTRCSLVDRLTITVGGRAVVVSPRALLLLADVNWGRVKQVSAGRYDLILSCGDAAAAYEADLTFDRTAVRRMDIRALEANMIEQSTVYHDVSGAFS